MATNGPKGFEFTDSVCLEFNVPKNDTTEQAVVLGLKGYFEVVNG